MLLKNKPDINPEDALDMMTVDTFAERVGVSTRKAYDMVSNREIESVKIGPKCRRITVAAYKQFLIKRTEAAIA